jgi:alkylation response protein AidB-like acyl-CoA dehydrogenase
MDFRPSASQQLLVATARQFLAGRCPIELVQRLTNMGGSGRPPNPPPAREAVAPLDTSGFDATLWRGMAELGWQGLLIPVELGGSGGSFLDVVLLVEEMGRACVPGPFIASAVAATSAILTADSNPLPLAGRGRGGGNDGLQKRILPAMADGERIATLALVEERASFHPDAVTLACEVPGRLTGRKLFVRDAHLADDLIVAVRAAGDLTLLLVPTDRPGVTRVPLATDGTERLFEVGFDGVAVGSDDVVGPPGHGRAPLVGALRAGTLARTAEMVGAAQRVMELTVEHAKTRVQGGRPIGGHQAIQHACADLVRDVDASRGLLYAAAWQAVEDDSRSVPGSPGRDERWGVWGAMSGPPMWSIAKAYAGEACLRVARRAHQIFGAISYCEEHPLHLFHKRIQAASLDFGDADLHLETVARAIGLV